MSYSLLVLTLGGFLVRSFHQSLESELEEAGYWWEDKARQAPEAKHWVARQGKALCGQDKALVARH